VTVQTEQLKVNPGHAHGAGRRPIKEGAPAAYLAEHVVLVAKATQGRWSSQKSKGIPGRGDDAGLLSGDVVGPVIANDRRRSERARAIRLRRCRNSRGVQLRAEGQIGGIDHTSSNGRFRDSRPTRSPEFVKTHVNIDLRCERHRRWSSPAQTEARPT